MSVTINVSRRKFLKTGALAGGGLVLGFYLPLNAGAAYAKSSQRAFQPNSFIRVGRDGTVTLVINKSEMGQGVYTSLPMLIAEELECDWKSIPLEPAPADPAYNHAQWGIQGTGGSTSVLSEWERLSKAGATAREMLLAAAAKTWTSTFSTSAAGSRTVSRVTKRTIPDRAKKNVQSSLYIITSLLLEAETLEYLNAGIVC